MTQKVLEHLKHYRNNDEIERQILQLSSFKKVSLNVEDVNKNYRPDAYSYGEFNFNAVSYSGQMDSVRRIVLELPFISYYERLNDISGFALTEVLALKELSIIKVGMIHFRKR